MDRSRIRIALVIDYITSDYSKTIISGIQAACLDLDVDLLIFPIGGLHNIQSPYDYQNVAVTSLISKQNIDGIIFETGSQMHSLTKAELTSYLKSYLSLPIVNIASELPGIPSIFVDSYNAYKALLTDLVVNQKCQKFGVIGARTNAADIKSRIKYIKQILEELNVPSKNITYWKAQFDYSNASQELETYYKTKGKFDFDALVAVTDEMAYAGMDFVKKLGKKIPSEVIVTGFDDLERSSFVTPALTSISQKIFEQGYEAVRLLLESINGNEIPKVTAIDALALVRASSQRYENPKNQKNSDFIKYIKYEDSNFVEKYSPDEWYSKKNQFYQVTKFYTEMQYDMNMFSLEKRINNDLKSFGITSCAIVIYDTPIEMATPFDYFNLPHKAFVFSAFDYATDVDFYGHPEKIRFDPNFCILPEGLINISPEGSYTISLFHNSLQYGYMLYRPGTYDISIYDLLSKIVSTIISSVYTYELVDDQREKINAKYNRLGVVANTDELTGLYNRRGLYEHGELALKFAKARNYTGAVIYCDIDGLKKINDTYGHESGDKAIIAEAIILKGNFRSDDVIARIGGDEFVVISSSLTYESFERIKARIAEDCKLWTKSSEAPFELSISMGYTSYPSDTNGYQLTALLSEADGALYKEKRIKKADKV